MPELPEVETTVRGLRERILGKTIRDFWCDHPGMLRYISPVELARLVKNKKIVAVRRRAKNILIDLSDNRTLVIHMKMTGHLLYGKYRQTDSKARPWSPVLKGGPLWDPYNRFIHAVFTLSDGKHLAFCDMRKFGRIALHETDNLHTSRELGSLGPELWEISAKEFRVRLLTRPKSKIKQALLNQTVIAGIGNIYSDEGLFAAGIHPLSKPSKIPSAKLIKLFRALIKITKKGLETGGDSMSDYRNVEGLGGRFQNFHKVYRREGGRCRLKGCAGEIERVTVAGRGARFCPEHQRKYV